MTRLTIVIVALVAWLGAAALVPVTGASAGARSPRFTADGPGLR